MSEVVNVVVAFAVIVFLVRWATKGGVGGRNEAHRRARELLGFHPKNVTPEMISTVQTMFPDIPQDNIQYDLLKTGNVQMTTNKLLERGYLEAPPPEYFQLYPTQPAPTTRNSMSEGSPSVQTTKPNLIARYNLGGRLSDQAAQGGDETPGGNAIWEETPERREASLRKRKAHMVLAARKRFLEQQQRKSSPMTIA